MTRKAAKQEISVAINPTPTPKYKKSPIRIEIRRAKRSQWYARIVSSANGRILFTSETYKRVKSARRAGMAIFNATLFVGLGTHEYPEIITEN